MFQFMINSLILMFSFIFSQMNHPLSMGLLLLIQTLLISLLIGTMSKTFWFAYILFLVFLGGMLVMFIYVTSLSSNEMFSISKISFFWLSFMLFISFTSNFLMDSSMFLNLFNFETITLNKFYTFMDEDSLSLNKLYNYSTNMITLFLINYLFLTLVICVKITNFFYGPLRPSF